MTEYSIQKIASDDLPMVRRLFKEYETLLGVDLCFQDFDNEISRLPGVYAEPQGCILKVTDDDGIVGVVALKPLSTTECEMKRLYIQDAYKGKGIGKAMATAVIHEARAKGYQLMKLDTLERLAPAVQLYKKLGFTQTQPYNYNPHEDILYFELQLQQP